MHLQFSREVLVTSKSIITRSIQLNSNQDCVADVDGVTLLLPLEVKLT